MHYVHGHNRNDFSGQGKYRVFHYSILLNVISNKVFYRYIYYIYIIYIIYYIIYIIYLVKIFFIFLITVSAKLALDQNLEKLLDFLGY